MRPRVQLIVFYGLIVLVGAAMACSASAVVPSTETPGPQISSEPTRAVGIQASPTHTSGPHGSIEAESTAEPSPGPAPTPTAHSTVVSIADATPTVVPVHSATPVATAPAKPVGGSHVETMFGPITCEPTSENIQLTSHIYPPDDFDVIIPMGRMWDSHVTPTDHLYWSMSEERQRGMVMSPADGTIVRVARFHNDQFPYWDHSQTEPDIRVIIAHSCDLFSIFIHVGELAPGIASIVGDLAPGESWHPGPGELIEVESGDPIARFGGSTIDYSLHDETVVLAGFQIPEHYEGEPWKVHTVDPFDYMTDELVADLLPKNERTVAPFGGQIDYDVTGTIAGNWFMDGTFDYGGNGSSHEYWNGHLAIAYDHIDPSQIRISIGRDIGITNDDCSGCGGVYAVNGNAPDPGSVTVSDGLVKYELTGRQHASPDSTEKTISNGVVIGTFLVQVLDDSSIKTEFVKGVPASGVTEFSAAAIVYRR